MTADNLTEVLDVDGAGPGGFEPAGGTEARRPARSSGLWSLVLGLLCLQSGLFLAFVAGRIETPLYLGLHLGLCVATAACGRWWIGSSAAARATGDMRAVVLQLVVWTALAGPFGTLIAVALLVPRRATASDAEDTGDTTFTINQGPELTRLELLHGSLLDRRLRLENAYSIRPLLDVVIDGTQIEKLDALGLISKRFVPALAPVLKRALEDKDAAVRVLAATVMAQQHNSFIKRIGALQATATEAPESAKHWSELGQAHLTYAESGLLERSRAEAETAQALAHLARAEQLDPANAEIEAPPNDREYQVALHDH